MKNVSIDILESSSWKPNYIHTISLSKTICNLSLSGLTNLSEITLLPSLKRILHIREDRSGHDDRKTELCDQALFKKLEFIIGSPAAPTMIMAERECWFSHP